MKDPFRFPFWFVQNPEKNMCHSTAKFLSVCLLRTAKGQTDLDSLNEGPHTWQQKQDTHSDEIYNNPWIELGGITNVKEAWFLAA